ncbi:MAG: oxidoreductase, partial [Syntrophobacteria bacterium]
VVANCGLTGGTNVATTVYPFILRGVSLLGIDSVFCPMEMRLATWKLLAAEAGQGDWLDSVGSEVTLEEVPDLIEEILKGRIRGRTVVRLEQ